MVLKDEDFGKVTAELAGAPYVGEYSAVKFKRDLNHGETIVTLSAKIKLSEEVTPEIIRESYYYEAFAMRLLDCDGVNKNMVECGEETILLYKSALDPNHSVVFTFIKP